MRCAAAAALSTGYSGCGLWCHACFADHVSPTPNPSPQAGRGTFFCETPSSPSPFSLKGEGELSAPRLRLRCGERAALRAQETPLWRGTPSVRCADSSLKEGAFIICAFVELIDIKKKLKVLRRRKGAWGKEVPLFQKRSPLPPKSTPQKPCIFCLCVV